MPYHLSVGRLQYERGGTTASENSGVKRPGPKSYCDRPGESCAELNQNPTQLYTSKLYFT